MYGSIVISDLLELTLTLVDSHNLGFTLKNLQIINKIYETLLKMYGSIAISVSWCVKY